MLSSLTVGMRHYSYYSFYSLSDLKNFGDLNRMPLSRKILLENLYRHQAIGQFSDETYAAFFHPTAAIEISFSPARVLMQDFTGVPAVVDLAAMRSAMIAKGGNPDRVNPLIPVDLVIDHSVTVDHAGTAQAFAQNVALEYARNNERYQFLRWGQQAFQNFRVVPPGTGICHQVNLEYLAQVVWCHTLENGQTLVYPDTVVGTDSHTTMINGLSVLGWGVGGIEAEAAMLGQPLSMLLPDVIGVQVTGILPEGCTATDLVLTLTQLLRKKGVVGKFVEFYGEGLSQLTLADRATLANMAPEYGATCGFFPIDAETIRYLKLTNRAPDHIDLVEAYAKAQGLWHDPTRDLMFADTVTLNLSDVVPSLAGPKRPQDKLTLSSLPQAAADLTANASHPTGNILKHHDVVIAAITSCTNTSNPGVLIAAGLLAQKAVEKGLTCPPYVKRSLAPGSQVVSAYLEKAGLLKAFEALGFYTVGFGCTTCIGNSGPLAETYVHDIEAHDLIVAGVLSGNRNFEGRINPHVKANYLASPPLVVAYALAGTTRIDLQTDPLGKDAAGAPVYLKDIWPTTAEIQTVMESVLTPALFAQKYKDVFKGDALWQSIETATGSTYTWDEQSTYVKHPPYFTEKAFSVADIKGARLLALFGDSITTDHISPAGSIKLNSPAGKYLTEHGIAPADFNAYGARRGNHDIMMRGTFANIRLQNELVPGTSGGYTRCFVGADSRQEVAIYDAAMTYQHHGVPLIIIAGKEYGTGSSRDWAAKGTRLLGVRAVVAESFERIHRSNLVGMGVLPLVFEQGITRKSLNLKGDETFDLVGLSKGVEPGMALTLLVRGGGECERRFTVICRIDTQEEVAAFQHGGLLPYMLEQLSR